MNGAPEPGDFWAKLKYENNDRDHGAIIAWHPLVAHSADVAAVVEILLTRTILRDRLACLAGWEKLSDVHVARLCVLSALHDAGKVNHGFQNRAFGRNPTADHVRPVISLFEAADRLGYFKALDLPAMLPWFPARNAEEAVYRYMLATWGHHGQPVQPGRPHPMLWEPSEARDPKQGLEELARCARQWFPEAYEEDAQRFPSHPALQHMFNGVLTLADWIGSDERFFEYTGKGSDPIVSARDRAGQAVEALFLDADPPRGSLRSTIGFDRVLGYPSWSPYPIQEAVRDVPLHDGGGLVVLESDTGSGKTEAALARFMRLYQAGQVDGMYFAVPTRSAATQLHGRVREACERIFPDSEKRPPVVQAVPGYIKADDVEATRLPNFEVRWDEDIQHRGWAAENAKRYLAGPIVVGTVDQVLLSALQVRHAHMRSAALLRHFLVVDEVHASDAYMTQLIDAVLDQHLASGGHGLLMSATLGVSARFPLLTQAEGDLPSLETAAREDYPLVSHVGAQSTDTPVSIHAASSGITKTVVPEIHSVADDPQAVAGFALEKARQGARVLVIRNLVGDCIDTHRAVEDLASEDSGIVFGIGGVRAPHHSRFAPEDRRRLDNGIEVVFGRDTSNQGVVAVATQTVEQSLDIDADLMITDLCPMDVLLQRIGRLHRHDRERPVGFETAACHVLTPSDRDLSESIAADGKAFSGSHGLGTVYDDLRVIEATWQLLEDEGLDIWQIPGDNRTLVEGATHPDKLDEIVESGGTEWKEHERWVLGSRQADRQAAGYVEVDRNRPFGKELFPDDLENVKTRLGQDDYRVLLPSPMPGPFGNPIEELSVSAWQLDADPETEEATEVTPIDEGFQFAFSGRVFDYTRFGLAQRGQQ